MLTLKEEILILVKEGILVFLSDPCRKFKIGTSYKPGSYYNAIRRLIEEGHIEKSKNEKDRKIHIRLTEEGKRFIDEHQESVRRFPPYWDKKWRLVVFDIPEEKRVLRNHLRRYLKVMGFGKVQRSIWISPYDLTEIIGKYIDKVKVSEYVFQITADKFKGFSELVLAKKFWNVKDIHDKYLDLIKEYTEKKKVFSGQFKDNPGEKEISGQILRAHIVWEYQSILIRDPHLPSEFLPDDWGGKRARKFVKSFLHPDSGRPKILKSQPKKN